MKPAVRVASVGVMERTRHDIDDLGQSKAVIQGDPGSSKKKTKDKKKKGGGGLTPEQSTGLKIGVAVVLFVVAGVLIWNQVKGEPIREYVQDTPVTPCGEHLKAVGTEAARLINMEGMTPEAASAVLRSQGLDREGACSPTSGLVVLNPDVSLWEIHGDQASNVLAYLIDDARQETGGFYKVTLYRVNEFAETYQHSSVDDKDWFDGSW